MEINIIQALSTIKFNSAEVKSDGIQEDFLLALNNAINSDECINSNCEEDMDIKNNTDIKIDIEDNIKNLLNSNYLDSNKSIKENEDIKNYINIKIEYGIDVDKKSKLSNEIEDNKLINENNEDMLKENDKINENLINLTNIIFNNMNYMEKQQFNIKEDKSEFKNNTQTDMYIVNNDVDKHENILDNLINYLETSTNKNNIENKIDFLKKTYNFNEIKNKLTNLVESNLQQNQNILNNAEENMDFTNDLELISNFRVLSMKEEIKVNDSKNKINALNNNDNKNEIDVLNNIIMINNNIDSEIKIESLQPNVVRNEFISNDIVESIKYLKTNNLEEIKVKMNPKDLGELHIKIIKENNEEKVFITLHNSETFNLVKDNVEEIKNHLNNLDININEINIEMKSENKNDFSQNLNQQFNRGNNKEQRRGGRIETEKENPIKDDVSENDSNINMLI